MSRRSGKTPTLPVDRDLTITMLETLRVWDMLCPIDLLRCPP
jgi:hypothetical protein